MVTIPVLAGVVYSLRFTAAEGDGPILAVMSGQPPVGGVGTFSLFWDDTRIWNDEDIWIG